MSGLEVLLNTLGCMPFAIRLVAKLGRLSSSMPEELWNIWQRAGPNILFGDPVARSIELSLNSKSMLNNIPAQTLLDTPVVLPVIATQSQLRRWAQQLGNKVFLILGPWHLSNWNNILWHIRSQKSLYPFIQSFDLTSTSWSKACGFIVEHKGIPGDESIMKTCDSSLLRWICNLFFSRWHFREMWARVTIDSELENRLEAFLAFCWYTHWTRRQKDLVKHGLTVAHRLDLETSKRDRLIAEFLLFCLDHTLCDVDLHSQSCAAFTEAEEDFQRLIMKEEPLNGPLGL